MAFINIYVHNDAYLSVKNNQLVLSNKNNEQSYPIEDINSIMIESLNSTITSYTLNFLIQNKALFYVCDEKHLPSAVLLPFNNFYKPLSVYKIQSQAKEPINKNIWKNIIISKIENQAKVAIYAGSTLGEKILEISRNVKSGDSQNAEAHAASLYFREVFGFTFTREQENFVNGALNYCYSIVRGAIARSITVHGLLGFLGIHHKSELNQFNLADDLIEPFRPVVDNLVLFISKITNEESISPSTKMQLLNILNTNVLINDKLQPISYAIEIVVESFVSCLTNNNSCIILPKFVGLEIHEYE
ncbi:MAG: type II CRISPR-associated endonuclease Cas1 [Clostridia bacterium]